MKVFSFKMNNTTALYLYIIKDCVNKEDAWYKLQEFTNIAKNQSDWDIRELENQITCIN